MEADQKAVEALKNLAERHGNGDDDYAITNLSRPTLPALNTVLLKSEDGLPGKNI